VIPVFQPQPLTFCTVNVHDPEHILILVEGLHCKVVPCVACAQVIFRPILKANWLEICREIKHKDPFETGNIDGLLFAFVNNRFFIPFSELVSCALIL
jgi:hypothetical protein